MISRASQGPFASRDDELIARIIHDSFFNKAVYVMSTVEMHESRFGKRTRTFYETKFENQNSPWKRFVFPTNSVSEIEDVVLLIKKYGGDVVTYQTDHPLIEEMAQLIVEKVDYLRLLKRAYERMKRDGII